MAKKGASDDLMASLRKLHQEHCNAIRELTSQQERAIEAALQACMTEMSSIEADAATEVRKSSDTYASAEREAPQKGTLGAHYWDHQKRVSDVANSARERAESARKAYLEAWKAAEQTHRDAFDKARRDYLARVQDLWKSTKIEDLDASAAAELVQGLDTILSPQSPNWC